MILTGLYLHYIFYRTLFVSKSKLKSAKDLINDYNSGKAQNIDPEKLWKAKKSL